MKTSSVQEKSRGVLLFAFNTTEIDYVEIARRSARLVRHTLNLPVTLVTEQDTPADGFDQVIYIDNTLQNYKIGERGAWRNGGGGAAWRNGGGGAWRNGGFRNSW